MDRKDRYYHVSDANRKEWLDRATERRKNWTPEQKEAYNAKQRDRTAKKRELKLLHESII